jgi:hypothetical protein
MEPFATEEWTYKTSITCMMAAPSPQLRLILLLKDVLSSLSVTIIATVLQLLLFGCLILGRSSFFCLNQILILIKKSAGYIYTGVDGCCNLAFY